ncbi:flagellar biosynthesis protein FlgB [Pseudoprimorskyibacter insulae]|uniref:Flagellar basal body rod protein FlgB n=1 Tax=Pseudoprimorskyibacter insulae TaxID=1695997 RepID=A0A2R8AYT9_9RHOB|nr:flagellar biosynthesis protein FlgB [Pseudoprimorskyibacter insulae]SPF81211.1 hypothetical protein PRI8871_03033 [Pseudoprimorskyibacter insulae]
MFQNLKVFQTAIKLAQHSAARQELIARNIANADTPAYQAKDLSAFALTNPKRDLTFRPSASRQGHIARPLPARFGEGVVVEDGMSANGNGVSLETEMVKSAESARAHSRAMTIYRSNLNILRASLGRN